jgi:3-hydroxyacyl-CoA dehydrogenase
MNFSRAAVIGAGAMGSGIACVLSQAGLEVVLKDVEASFVERGLANIKRMYESRVKKEVLSQSEADRLFSLVKGTTGNDGFDQVDLVIEAALEKINVKLEIFRELDRICPARTILATNTSALSISEIAFATKRPDKVVGMHFFNPAHVMKLVEIIPGVKTSREVVSALLDFSKNRLQKAPVEVQECPGFLVNRLLFPYLNESLYVLQEGQYSAWEIDEAAVAFGLPMGPLTLLDMTGIEICLHVNQFLNNEYGTRFETAPLLRELEKKGFLGQKSGAGIYLHPSGKPAAKGERKELNSAVPEILKQFKAGSKIDQPTSERQPTFDVYRVVLPMFNEAVYALQEGVVKGEDIDPALKNGIGLGRGLLSLAQEQGLSWCHEKLDKYRSAHGERFQPSWYLSKLVRAGLHDFRELESAAVSVR